MTLYVCWGTFPVPWPRCRALWRRRAHACKIAYDALREAGHSPKVVRCYGFAALPDLTSGPQYGRRLTGNSRVPVLVLADGTTIEHSQAIAAWAKSTPSDLTI
jgi:hypothetical protein